MPKKNIARKREYRVVYKVRSQALSLLQKNIATSIAAQWSFPEYVQGFVAERSIRSNAKRHLAKRYILKADIKNFFGSITFDQVATAFKRLGCRDPVAEVLAGVCTLNGTLPQGTATSPILSNIVCVDMDDQLCSLGRQFNTTYSRYADDVTFSGDSLPSKDMIEAIFNRFGFQMHPDKFYMAKRGRAQFVTGLSVFDNKQPRVPKRMKRNLRQELYYIKKFGMVEHIKRRYGLKVSWGDTRILREGARITGWIDFITSIEPVFGNKVKNLWIDICGDISILHEYRKYSRRLE